jgi:outer membrane lipoprotein SlyB
MRGFAPTTAASEAALHDNDRQSRQEARTMTVDRLFTAATLMLSIAFTEVAGAQAPAPQAAPPAPAASPPARVKVCAECGVVRSVKYVEKKGNSSGVGAVAGGVLGGVLGHQIGSGRGNTAATILGAGAGAYAGNEVEKNKKKTMYWSVSVKMENGTTRNYTYGNKPEFREGDRVKTLDEGRRLALAAN